MKNNKESNYVYSETFKTNLETPTEENLDIVKEIEELSTIKVKVL